jgi:hypothetical protein
MSGQVQTLLRSATDVPPAGMSVGSVQYLESPPEDAGSIEIGCCCCLLTRRGKPFEDTAVLSEQTA